eukprot:4430193-Prymnesium_polylepis.1
MISVLQGTAQTALLMPSSRTAVVRAASCRLARDAARAATSNRTRRQRTRTIASCFAIGAQNVPPARRAAPNRLCCRPQRSCRASMGVGETVGM